MPMSPEDFEIFKRHIQRFPDQAPCEVCHEEGWEALGVDIQPMIGPQPGMPIGGPRAPVTVPLLVMVCTTCFHVPRHFRLAPDQGAGHERRSWLSVSPLRRRSSLLDTSRSRVPHAIVLTRPTRS
jgi:hypothetical protein